MNQEVSGVVSRGGFGNGAAGAGDVAQALNVPAPPTLEQLKMENAQLRLQLAQIKEQLLQAQYQLVMMEKTQAQRDVDEMQKNTAGPV